MHSSVPAAALAILLSAPGAQAAEAERTTAAGDAPAAARAMEDVGRGDGRGPSRAVAVRAGGGANATVLEEVSGTVREVDRTVHRLVVEAGKERITLSLDRNTMVYTPSGLGTVLDVVPGARIRAGRNADFLAYWVHVLGPAGVEPPSAPGQGTGPGGGSGPPGSEAAGPSSSAAPGPSASPGPAAAPDVRRVGPDR